MTFPDGRVISQTEEDTTFWKNTTFNGKVTFPDEFLSQIEIKRDGWITDMISYFVENYVLAVNPTFTGTITFDDPRFTGVVSLENENNNIALSTDFLKTTTAADTYTTKDYPTFTNTVTFKHTDNITTYITDI
jgi:hypothetical protein